MQAEVSQHEKEIRGKSPQVGKWKFMYLLKNTKYIVYVKMGNADINIIPLLQFNHQIFYGKRF